MSEHTLYTPGSSASLGLPRRGDPERKLRPSDRLGEDHNSLRQIVASEFTEVQEFLPPEACFEHRSVGKSTQQSFGETYLFCSQILELIHEHYPETSHETL